MDVLSLLSRKIIALVDAKRDYEMTLGEYEEQKKSFVVGNSFDAFDGNEEITRTSIEKLELKRRQTAA